MGVNLGGAENQNNAINEQEQTVKKVKNNAKKNVKKTHDKATKPVRQAKSAAQSYGKRMGKQAAKKAMKPVNEAAKKAMQKVAEAAKKVAEQVAKALAKAAKAIGKALAKAIKAIAEAIGKAIASLGPYGWIALAIILVIIIAYGAAVYNSEKISFWFIGDSTADGSLFDSAYYDDAITLKAALEADTENNIIGNDLPMLSKSDVIMILDHIIQYNQDMAFEVGIGSKYKEYAVARYAWDMTVSETANLYYGMPSNLYTIDEAIEKATDDTVKQSLNELKNSGTVFRDKSLNCGYVIDPLPHTSGLWDDTLCINMSYGQVATLNIEGTEAEKYFNGTYDIDWKLMLILAEMMAESKAAQFGNNSDWSEEDQEKLNNSEWFEASMDGYFLTDEDITNLCKLFDYNIRCYPDDMGYDYVQIGKLYEEDPYNSSGVVTNISIKWPWQGGITKTFNEGIEHAYESDVVKRMSFTLYPCTDVYGNYVGTSQGIVKNDSAALGKWTYVAPYDIGDVFDGDEAITIDSLGNTAVKYVSDGTNTYIMNDDEMYYYRAFSDLFVPYIAPRTISNIFMKAEYLYEDVKVVHGHTAEEYGMDEGTLALSKIVITIDADNFYTQISQLIPGFSFEHFFELYEYYKVSINEEEDSPQTKLRKQSYNASVDMEIARWKNIEELYNKAKEAKEAYTTSYASGITPPYPSLEAAANQGRIEVSLPKTAIDGPTKGNIFIGGYSQNKNASGSSAEITGKNGVWIGESHGRRYYDFLTIENAARASIIRQDKFIESENAYEKLSNMCDTLFHQIQEWGYFTGEPADDYSITAWTDYTVQAFDGDCGGPVWVHFCNCYEGQEPGTNNCRHGIDVGGHTYNNWSQYQHYHIVYELMDWQKSHPDYSVTALLVLVAVKAYMQDDPWIINRDSYIYDDLFTACCQVLDKPRSEFSPSDLVGTAYNHPEYAIQFLFNKFDNIIDEQISKGPQSFFDLEFGNGFNNTTIDQTAYRKAEIKYTYKYQNSSPETNFNVTPKLAAGVYPAWWEDKFFPEENQGQLNATLNNNNDGWCNIAARLWESMLHDAGYTCWGICNWPMGIELGDSCVVTSPFGWRIYSYDSDKDGVAERFVDNHGGIDFGIAQGTQLLSVCDGTVINFETCGSAGYMVTILGDDGYTYKYMHMITDSSEGLIEKNGRVKAGDLIGYSGNTGGSTGPHLHFQIEKDGVALDPAPFLGLEPSNPYWRTHRVYYSQKEAEDAYADGTYNNKF